MRRYSSGAQGGRAAAAGELGLGGADTAGCHWCTPWDVEPDIEDERRKVGRCRLKPDFPRTESDVLRLGSLTQRLCVILCYLTTCYSFESAWYQRLILKHDKLLSSFAFSFKLRRYSKAREEAAERTRAERQRWLEAGRAPNNALPAPPRHPLPFTPVLLSYMSFNPTRCGEQYLPNPGVCKPFPVLFSSTASRFVPEASGTSQVRGILPDTPKMMKLRRHGTRCTLNPKP